ncbi:hypothetical protein O7602_23325 [Micromonospora sp. WMMD1128]|uniref:hypothetical protein n=1 Tax=Micromonospora sp. WMMD1128 TaxID=3015150 RepID=UPI00248B26E4|nr:hypothetical protein [Micromonospora sp. WMMD1128]WBB72609.1 hypothetical protein O7602_23325 [Micromonospora sp. WMMD1128]
MLELRDRRKPAVPFEVTTQIDDSVDHPAGRQHARPLDYTCTDVDGPLRLTGEEKSAAQPDLVEDDAADVRRPEGGDSAFHAPHSLVSVRASVPSDVPVHATVLGEKLTPIVIRHLWWFPLGIDALEMVAGPAEDLQRALMVPERGSRRSFRSAEQRTHGGRGALTKLGVSQLESRQGIPIMSKMLQLLGLGVADQRGQRRHQR